MSKPIVATTSLAGCFGCHMSLLDIDDRILELIELVEFNKSPIDDIKKFTKKCDIGLIAVTVKMYIFSKISGNIAGYL
jgi:NAD-reducing hydrogenase small subunit